jgi:predicted dehydrogenase
VQARGKGIATREEIAVPAGDMFRDELEQFADAIVLGRTPEISAGNGLHALAAVYASIASARNGGRECLLAETLAAAAAGVPDATNEPAGTRP